MERHTMFMGWKLNIAKIPVFLKMICINKFSSISLRLKWFGGISGGFRELWSLMSQHRKNPARGRVVGKKWLMRIGCLWGLQMGQQEGAMCQELSGLWFYNHRRSGKELKDHLLPHSWVDTLLPLSAPPPGWAGEFFLSLHGQAGTCHGTVEMSKKIVTYAKNCESFQVWV